MSFLIVGKAMVVRKWLLLLRNECIMEGGDGNPYLFLFITNKEAKGLKALGNELLSLISNSFFRNGESIFC